MSMATAWIFAPLGRSRFQIGLQRVGPLAIADKDDGAALHLSKVA